MDIHPAVRPISDSVDLLGESPVWDERAQALWWVDVRRPCVQRHDARTGETTTWPMPELVGSLAMRGEHDLVVALATRIVLFDAATATLTTVASPEDRIPHRRFNDGRCDRQGRFWAGTMDDVTRDPVGTLYRLDPAGACTPAFSGIRTPNSLAWSPDGRTMYFADSYLRAIFAYPFDPDSGTLGERRVFAHVAGTGMPDGSSVDADGYLWNAEYDGARVTRYAPDGRVDRVLHLPVRRPTSCAFGGPDLDVLYVTTACQRLSEAERAAQPLAGAVLAVDIGIQGLPEPRFAG